MFSELLWIYTSVTESNASLPRGSNAMLSQHVAELNIQIWNSHWTTYCWDNSAQQTTGVATSQ